jgi:hypothetical protein
MKHATQEALSQITRTLERVRSFHELKERKLGIFYLRGVSFLHFHEDPLGLFADLKVGEAWRRIDVTKAEGQDNLIREVSNELSRLAKP